MDDAITVVIPVPFQISQKMRLMAAKEVGLDGFITGGPSGLSEWRHWAMAYRRGMGGRFCDRDGKPDPTCPGCGKGMPKDDKHPDGMTCFFCRDCGQLCYAGVQLHE